MDSDPEDLYAKFAIDELFSKAEADSFVDWLKLNMGATDEDTAIVEAALPLPRIMGFGAIAIGGAQDHVVLKAVAQPDPASSPLGFTVLGYYDLRDHEPIDKSVPARHQFCSLYVIDGKVVRDYGELLELWRAGKIVAQDEIPPRVNAPLPF
jgi:hypothetical protein